MVEKKKILVADDAQINRQILVRALKDDYDVIEAADGEQTLHLIIEHYRNLAVVLLDITMPRINGFQVMEVLNKKDALKYLPIILITGDKSAETMRKGYQYGAVEFLTKPFDIQTVNSCISNVIRIYDEKNRLEILNLKQNRELRDQAERLKKMNSDVMDMLGSVVEFPSFESNSHVKIVKEFTRIMLESMRQFFPEYELTDEKIEFITVASSLHDIGKIMIPDAILLKPAKLSSDEYEIMKSHTTKGCEILSALSDYQDERYAQYSYEICRYHHERYDGKGYPEGLKGEKIPLSAQVVSIVEAFAAMLSNNIYREPIEFEAAFKLIVEGECGMFAPKVLQCFKANKEKFIEIESQYGEKAFY